MPVASRHCGDGYFLGQSGFLVVESGNLLGGLIVLSFYSCVFCCEMLIGAVKRVDLDDIAAQYGSHRSQFAFESCDLTGIRALGVAQLLQQAFGYAPALGSVGR